MKWMYMTNWDLPAKYGDILTNFNFEGMAKHKVYHHLNCVEETIPAFSSSYFTDANSTIYITAFADAGYTIGQLFTKTKANMARYACWRRADRFINAGCVVDHDGVDFPEFDDIEEKLYLGELKSAYANPSPLP